MCRSRERMAALWGNNGIHAGRRPFLIHKDIDVVMLHPLALKPEGKLLLQITTNIAGR
jgi:hypothetical protein